MSGGLFSRQLATRARAVLDTGRPEVELAHAMRALITVLGLVQLSGVLLSASRVLSDGAVEVVAAMARGHEQLLEVHAAEVTARAIGIAVQPADIEAAHANALRHARLLGPCASDPRAELTGRLRALLGPEGAPRDPERDVRGLCAGIAHLAARIGLFSEIDSDLPAGIPGPPGVSTDIRRTPTTRPAPPAEEEGDADAS